MLEFKPGGASRPLDCVTIGRANMDLYPPVGEHFIRARRYEAFVGGSPANIAAGIVRRGLKAGIITKAADDGIGRFVRDYLSDFGVDISHLLLERSEARTSLVFAERRRDAQTVFYRQQPSDLLLESGDIDADYVAGSRVLFLSGSAVCREPCRGAVQTAVDAAKKAGTVTAMDIDYRPHGWQDRDISSVLQRFALQCDVLIGTAEEFRIAAGQADGTTSRDEEDSEFLRLFPQARLLVVKRGRDGANAYERDGTTVSGVLLPAALKKPWGAGDAFASSLLSSLLLGKGLDQAMLDGAASASLNISGTSCTEAMPDSDQIDDFLKRFRSGQLPPDWVD